METLHQLNIQQVNWQANKDTLSAIRHAVFVIEQNVPQEEEWDDQDENAVHFLCLNNKNIPIATARLLATGQIGRMAVAKEYRRIGLGKKLMEFIISTDAAKQHKILFLHAQLTAILFYEKLGFTISNDEIFEDAGILHKSMEFHYD